MWINRQHRLGFIHIPRTGGTAIIDCLEKSLPGGWHSPIDYPHMTLENMRDLVLSEEVWKLRWFAVLRDPVDVMLSHWGWIMRLPSTEQVCPEKLRRYVRASREHDNVSEFIRWLFFNNPDLSRGGFWPHWCEGDGLPVVKPIRFERLGDDFASLMKGWDIPGEFKLKKLNGSPVGNSPDCLRSKLRPEVFYNIRKICWRDMQIMPEPNI